MSKGVVMACPCGHEAKAVSIVCSIVKIRTFHCKNCGRIIRQFELHGVVSKPSLVEALETLHKANMTRISESRKLAIDYLERMIDRMNAQTANQMKSARQKHLDLWEKKYLKEQLGDDYYA